MELDCKLKENEKLIEEVLNNNQGNGDNESDGNEEDKRVQAQILIDLAGEAELFHSNDGTGYATIEIGGTRQNWPIKSKEFKNYLVKEFYDLKQRPPGSQALQDALNTLEANASYVGPELPVYKRVARRNENIYIDLCDSSWGAIEVSSGGWQIVDHPPVKFIRSKDMLPLCAPERNGSIEELRGFINIEKESDWRLIISWILAAIRPDGPFPILVLKGEQGSAKSTVAKVLRELVDPYKAPLRSAPLQERDLAVAANNSWVLVFDNISRIPPWLSDGLCRVATGGGFAVRTLYTDSEETVFDYKRPIILNGIDEIVTRHDLLDRCIIINLPVISDEERVDESTFWVEFNKAKGRIFGAILDGAVEGLRNYDRVELETLPRMADFAKWVVASEAALPWPEGGFMESYTGNREEAVDIALDSDCVAVATKQLIDEKDEFEGNATELLDALKEHVDEQTYRSKSWPKTARGLSNRVRRSATFLRQKGIEIEHKKTNQKRLFIIRRQNSNENKRHDSHTVTLQEAEGAPEVTETTEVTKETSHNSITSPSEPSQYEQCDDGDEGDEGDGEFNPDSEDLTEVKI